MNGRPISFERMALATAMAALAALLLAPALAGISLPLGIASAVAVAVAGLAFVPIARRLPTEWDGAMARQPVICVAWLLVAAAALVRTAGIAWFMADPAHADASAFWFDDFYIRHSCMSSYWHGAQLAQAGVSNLYDPAHYTGFEGRFKLDEFLYLPQFLILPRAALALGLDFQGARALWFGVEGALLAGSMIAICAWIGGAAGRRAALLIPAVWLGSPVMVTLQVGNFQLLAISLSVLAMVLFERGRTVLGGALLGFTVFKLFPGLLGIYLLATRQWRAAAWTLAFAVLYSVLALAWLGTAPFEAFVHFQLPRLASGEAWSFLELDGLEAVNAINDSVPGLALKLKLVGLLTDPHAVESVLAWLWTALAVVAAIVGALRRAWMSRLECTMLWIALLAAAVYRSLFVPDHNGLFAPLWLLSIAAAAAPMRRHWLALLPAWVALTAVLPFGGMPLPGITGRLALSTFCQLMAICLCLWALARRPTRLGEATAASPSGSPHSGDAAPVFSTPNEVEV